MVVQQLLSQSVVRCAFRPVLLRTEIRNSIRDRLDATFFKWRFSPAKVADVKIKIPSANDFDRGDCVAPGAVGLFKRRPHERG